MQKKAGRKAGYGLTFEEQMGILTGKRKKSG